MLKCKCGKYYKFRLTIDNNFEFYCTCGTIIKDASEIYILTSYLCNCCERSSIESEGRAAYLNDVNKINSPYSDAMRQDYWISGWEEESTQYNIFLKLQQLKDSHTELQYKYVILSKAYNRCIGILVRIREKLSHYMGKIFKFGLSNEIKNIVSEIKKMEEMGENDFPGQ